MHVVTVYCTMLNEKKTTFVLQSASLEAFSGGSIKKMALLVHLILHAYTD